ncbi:MAG: hypothetical protein LBI62_03920 [Candidatus Accumulibacter sp.]|jgi:glutamine synthetase type III|nr:hypothetical protein [Accumulibacter sp.]
MEAQVSNGTIKKGERRSFAMYSLTAAWLPDGSPEAGHWYRRRPSPFVFGGESFVVRVGSSQGRLKSKVKTF